MSIAPETCHVLCRTYYGGESEDFHRWRESDVSDRSLTANLFLDTWVSAGTARFYVTDDNKAVKWRNGDLVCQNPANQMNTAFIVTGLNTFYHYRLTLYEPKL